MQDKTKKQTRMQRELDKLITRVGLLKAGYLEAAFSRERLCILQMIEVAIKIRSTQEELSSKSIRRKRKYGHGQEKTVRHSLT